MMRYAGNVGESFTSCPATLRFKVGYGIVDASGALVRDTVPPAAVGRVRVSVSGAKAVLRWSRVADPILTDALHRWDAMA